MQTADSNSFSTYRPDHMSPADPVKVWLDHPHRRPFASSCGSHQAPILPRWQSRIGRTLSGLGRRELRMWLRQPGRVIAGRGHKSP